MATATCVSNYPKEVFIPKYSTGVVLRPMSRNDSHDLLIVEMDLIKGL